MSYNRIEEDMMQDMNENESDGSATKNEPRPITILVTDHTNDQTLDDNHIPTGSRESSRVVTPTVTGKTDCEKYDRGQRISIHQPDAISNMDGKEQKQSRNQSAKIAKDGAERCKQQHEEDVRPPTKASSSIPMTQGGGKVDQARYRHKEKNPQVKTVDGNDTEPDVNDLLQDKYSCQTDGSAIRYCGL